MRWLVLCVMVLACAHATSKVGNCGLSDEQIKMAKFAFQGCSSSAVKISRCCVDQFECRKQNRPECSQKMCECMEEAVAEGCPKGAYLKDLYCQAAKDHGSSETYSKQLVSDDSSEYVILNVKSNKTRVSGRDGTKRYRVKEIYYKKNGVEDA